ncbi:MAG TPA: hypothetical protein VGM06_25205 [Polyangiaceae bacterium]|jgi:photosystem II stability/assembly factor-like uncharacterized protein
MSCAAPRPVVSQPTEHANHPYVWKNVAILGGGFVTGIVFSPTEPHLAYARTDVGGAYRWDDAANTWVPLLDWVTQPDWNLHGIESIAPDPVDARRVYLAAGTYTNPDVSNGEILFSADYGETWRRTPMPFKMGGNEAGRGSGERLAIDPHDPRIVYFGSRKDGLWKSADGALSFARVPGFPDLPDGSAGHPQSPKPGEFNYLAQAVGIVFVRFDPASGRDGQPTPVLYAAISRTGESLFRSRDAGATWEAVPDQPTKFRPVRADLAADGALFVTYADEPGPNHMGDGAVYKLDTRTGRFADVTPERPLPAEGRPFGYAAVSVDPSDPQTVVVSTWNRSHPFDEIFRTKDGGTTWTPLLEKASWNHAAAPYTATMRHHWMSTVVIDPFERGHLLFTTGFGIWGTRDALRADAGEPTRWTFDDRGLEETVPLALVSAPTGAHLVSGLGDIDGFRHDDLSVSPPQGRFDAPGFKNTEFLDYAGRAPDVLVRSGTTYGNDRILGAWSRDAAAHWTGFASEPPRSRPDRFGTGPIAVSADGTAFVWTTRHNPPYVTRDQGATWQPVAGAPADLALVSDRVDALRFYGVDPIEGVLYASADAGASVQAVRRALPVGREPRRHSPLDVRAVPDHAGELWIAVDHALFRVRAAAGYALERFAAVEQASSVGFGKAADGASYPAVFVAGKVGGRYGIFRSDDAGATWIRASDDAHGYGSASHVTGDPRVFGRVYFATGGRGIVYGDIAP